MDDSGHNETMKLTFVALAAVTVLFAAEVKLGKPLSQKEPMPLAALMSKPDQYVGQTVQVKGKITAVCQMMGCWMELTNDSGAKVRIKVEDGDIVFPKDSAGKMAIAE